MRWRRRRAGRRCPELRLTGSRPARLLLLAATVVLGAGLPAFRGAARFGRIGATHCTGEKAIEAFRKEYGARFVEMGAGRVVELP